MDPSVEELDSFVDLHDALKWAAVTDRPAKALLDRLGRPTCFRDIALIPKPIFDRDVAALEGSAVDAARLEAFRRACVRKCGGNPDLGILQSSGPSASLPETDLSSNVAVELCASVARAVVDAHAGLLAVTTAADDVRRAVEREAERRRQFDQHEAAEELRRESLHRELAQERERMGEEAAMQREKLAAAEAELLEEREAVLAEKARLENLCAQREEQMQLLRAKGSRSPMVQICVNCSKTFIVSENTSRSCRYHKGRWATAGTGQARRPAPLQSLGQAPPSSGSPSQLKRSPSGSRILAIAASAMLADARSDTPSSPGSQGGASPMLQALESEPSSPASPSPAGAGGGPPKQWSCCRSRDELDSGCCVGAHVAKLRGMKA
eukprot:TRINITY_DN26444_c0_g3_i1.p1 TRINITY_DN26444_c0_g3~~TRINITY_DN26444_c0_g3_i1.p1  ORF type:complete len:381 (+),score=93.98 TRINITY_DN26444_c0_g3_i1:159-1301(+)